ncbi:thioredoxin [Marixanthomonas ophiurae]|uniref:Thioredoxin n=2 Tax=Marixanthomonas ophiurae TaxID=387659 RepID=A0A3E1QEC1_9FLAO|nr:thioredoxin [Marixanthomonas ophiurae]
MNTEKTEVTTKTPQMVSEKSSSEEINKTVPYKESVILLGKANRSGLKKAPFGSWFDKNFETYNIDEELVSKIAPLLKDVKITTFMGTWCGDSKRETPRLYKILDAANYNYDNFKLITVSREKDTPSGYEEGLNITNVPTIIFYKDGEEMGRFVEYAIESLEADVYAILSGADYKHAYEE